MANMNIDLPEDLRQFIRSEIEEGRYRSESAYVEALVARAKAGKERLESLLIEGLDSGEPRLMDDAAREKLRNEAR